MMSGTTICLLSDFSITYLQLVLDHFADEFKAHVAGQACGAARCRGGAFGVSQELVTITVNGRQAQVPKGMLLVEAAKIRRG